MVNGGLFRYVPQKRAGRAVALVPGFFLKFAKTPLAQAALAAEVASTRRARDMEFWEKWTLPIYGVCKSIGVTTRQRAATLDDWDMLVGEIDRKVEESLQWRCQSIADVMAKCTALHVVGSEARKRILVGLRGGRIPVTGMHGDLHLYNCLRGKRGNVLLCDWEHFDEHGSFAFDYLNFFVSRKRWESGKSFLSFLGCLSEADKDVVGAAERFDISPRNMLKIYKIVRVSIMIDREGGMEAVPEKKMARLRGIIESL